MKRRNDMSIKAIETSYSGYKFRSRLEARYAFLFDLAGVDWSYEPEGFDLGNGDFYLPDFFLALKPSHWRRKEFDAPGYWVEIKGSQPTEGEISKLHRLAVGTKNHGYIFYGDPGKNSGVFCSLDGHIRKPWEDSFSTIGLEASVIFSDCTDACLSYESIVKMIEKSRSARFEHGQKGAR
jgi:hypothetical protein